MKLSHLLLLILPLAAISPMLQLGDSNLETIETHNQSAKSSSIMVVNEKINWSFSNGDYMIYDSTNMSEDMRSNMAGDPHWDQVVLNWADVIRIDFLQDEACTVASYNGQCHKRQMKTQMNITGENNTNNEKMSMNISIQNTNLIPLTYSGWEVEIIETNTRMWMGELTTGHLEFRSDRWVNSTNEIETTGWQSNYTVGTSWNEHTHTWTNSTTEEFSEFNHSGNWMPNYFTDSESLDEEKDWFYDATQEVPVTFNGYNLANSAGSSPTTLDGILLEVWEDDKGNLIQEQSEHYGEYGYPLSMAGGDITELYHSFGATMGSDTDGDGVSDGSDLCPNTPPGSTVDSDGCTWDERDDDGDGVLNPADNCADTTSSMTDVDAQGCAYEQRDDDSDGVLNPADQCPTTAANSNVDSNGCAPYQLDSDNDTVSDANDSCPGHDDLIDVDGDGTPDGCDTLIDNDGDGISNAADLCEGHDDSIDIDQDGTPDGCDSLIDSDSDGVADSNDLCPGHDDSIDVDSDGIPDNCDSLIDSDSDGVSDGTDACPGFDDSVDADSDGIPDGCDDFVDSDSDGVADSDDKCLGYDDTIDLDSDGIPDGCDSLLDSDGDGVSDTNDQCPGYIDSFDADSDGIPDGCDDLIDNDGDGVSNGQDLCPSTDSGVTVDDTGCKKIVTSSTSEASGGFSPIMAGGLIAAVIVAILVVVFVMRQRSSQPRVDEGIPDLGGPSAKPTSSPSGNAFSPSVAAAPPMPAQPHPSQSGEVQPNGYEYLEHPANSGNWWYRTQENSNWFEWQR